jgi:hypothetical protein
VSTTNCINISQLIDRIRQHSSINRVNCSLFSRPTGLFQTDWSSRRGWVYIPVSMGLGSKKGNACLLNGETEKRNLNLTWVYPKKVTLYNCSNLLHSKNNKRNPKTPQINPNKPLSLKLQEWYNM